MKKRIRKKLHLGEFQEFGFEISFNLIPNLSDKQLDAFFDEFIMDAVEKNSLFFGGGGNKQEWEGFLALNRRGSATEGHRANISKWLASNPKVVDFEVGKLIDAWHGDFN
ncbi:MAG: hypothetical protein DRJ05_02015 [Bacteroidetes bacterium]|nr:MAG: hypothetical protein DRJ05_02015 [Bacteroidota bacterium]